MPTVGSRGEKLDLLVRQGTTLGPIRCQMKSPSGVPVDLSGCVIRASMKKAYGATNKFDFGVEIPSPQEGRFSFGMTPGVSSTIPCGASPSDQASQYVWDMEVEYPDGTTKPIFYGSVKVAPEATK